MAAPIRLGPLLLTRPIGRGGMGTVWHAQHPEGVDAAIKVLRIEDATDEELISSFRFEARSVASLDHPAIVQIYDYGVVPRSAAEASEGRLREGSPWLAMEYTSAGTFAHLGPMPSYEALRGVVLHLLGGLAHSHAREIIHRDIKPQNVLVRHDGPAMLTDFGIAHTMSQHSPSSAGAGTPGYMPPEQIRSEWRDVGPWTDLYALGCLVWRLLTGRPPIGGKHRREVLRRQLTEPLPSLQTHLDVPQGLEAWLHRLLAVDPIARFQRAADAAAALLALPEPAQLPPPIPVEWRAPHPATHERPRGMGLAVFLLRPWPLVGRSEEQDQLWSALRRVIATETAGTAVLFGGPGVGKSRLARWLCERADETGAATVIYARHDRSDTSGLVATIRTNLRLQDLTVQEVFERLTVWMLEREIEDAEDRAARLTGLLMPDDGRGNTPVLHVLHPKQRLEVWLELIEVLVRERPLLLCIDDLHRADEALELAIALEGLRAPVLVVATLNPELVPGERAEAVERLVRGSGVELIDVEPLSDADQRQLIDSGVGLSPRLSTELVRRTAGNPLFAVGTVISWAQQGLLVPTSDGFDLRKGARPQLPSSIREHIDARLAPLEASTPRAVIALELLAALGGARIREADWIAACAEAAIPLTPVELRAIADEGLIESLQRPGGPLRWSLDHTLLRDGLQHRAAEADRLSQHHAAAGRALITSSRTSAQDRALRHLVEGGAPREALAALDRLRSDAPPKRLLALLDFELRLLDRLRLPAADPRRIRIEIDRAEAMIALEQGDSTVLAGEALERARASDDLGLQARAGLLLLSARQLDGSLRHDDPLLASVEDWCRLAGDPARLATLQRLRGQAHAATGDMASAEAHLTHAAIQAEDTQQPQQGAMALVALGEGLARQGRIEEAEAQLEAAQALYLAEGDELARAELEAYLAGLARRRGDLIRSRERAFHARQALRQLGANTWSADLEVGLAHLVRGELSQARRELAAVARAALSAPPLALIARGALLCCSTGSWEVWDRLLTDFEALAQRLPAVEHDSAWPLEWSARRAAEAGEAQRARWAYELVLGRYEALGDAASAARVRKRLAAL